MREMILASASPRRRELLDAAGIPYCVVVSDADETTDERDPERLVKLLSKRKCEAVADRTEGEALILAADTVVSVDEEILGKPADAEAARAMLKKLSGRAHRVYTGVAMQHQNNQEILFCTNFAVCTEVHFAKISDEEIVWYIASEEPYDKAGSYAIQGLFSRFITRIDGDYTNVVGLPIRPVYEIWRTRWMHQK